MSYNKLGFTSGQTLKAEHLNHMEEGIANAGRGLKVLEVTTIEELYSKVIVLDNPVFFKLFSDEFKTTVDLGDSMTENGTNYFTNADVAMERIDGVTVLYISQLDVGAYAGSQIVTIGTETIYNVSYPTGQYYEGMVDTSNTKFTLYYF